MNEGIFGKIIDVVTGGAGGLAGQIIGAVKEYLPPDMSPEKKAELTLAAERLGMEKEKQLNDAVADAEKRLNERIAQYEGTASDLKSVPFVGSIMLFLRGAQRPIWGYATIYMDFEVMSGAWKMADDHIGAAFYILNILVGGFLFGERAIQNVAPYITQMIAAKKGA